MSDGPANLEAEVAFLGAVLIDNALLAELSVSLRPEHFSEPLHARIFERIVALTAEGQRVTPVTLKPHFEADPAMAELGGTGYLARLTADGQGLLAPRELAEQIRELAHRRAILARAADPDANLADLAALIEQASTRTELPVVDLAAWKGPPPHRQSMWGDLLPMHQTTLLTGMGGVGKSLLAQALCAHVSLGEPFLGLPITRRNALYFTCEDDEPELWRRMDAICQAFGTSIAALAGRLTIVCLAGDDDTALMAPDPSGRLIATPRWRALELLCERRDVGLLAIDNAADAMAGDHNDIHHVAKFVNRLTGLAIRRSGVSLILAHPNKGGDDWLGSVAWHNKVRSRLVLRPSDTEGDLDARFLQNPKANYAASGGRLDFHWYRGAFVRDADLPADYAAELAASIQAASDNSTFLQCLAERNRQRRAVSEKRSPTFAPAVFAAMPESKRIGKERLERAMDRLFRLGEIERAELWKGEDRKPVFGLRETAGNGAGNGAVNTVRERGELFSTPRENDAGNAANTYSPLYERGSGPLGGPPPPESDELDWGGEFDPEADE